jgi:hypothetical protein
MTYNKTTWGEREVEFPNRFVMVDNGDGTVTLTPSFGNVIQGGTPLSVLNMQKIDDQLENMDLKVSASIEDSDVVLNDKNADYTWSDEDLIKAVEYWPDGETKRRETDYTYSNGDLTTAVSKIYNTSGVLQKAVTKVYSYTNQDVTGVERSVI